MAKLTIKNKYGVIPNDILNEKSLSMKAKGLYAYIQSKPENWDFSIQKICLQTKESFDGIGSGIKELEDYGVLKRLKFQNEKGYRDIEYILYEKPEKENRDKENPIKENPLQENHINISNKDFSKKEYSNKDFTNNIYIDQFEIFWSEYPNKKGKPKAQEKYIKILKNKEAIQEDIMNGLNNYKKEIKIQGTEKQFIKHPATRLNQGCRNDEYNFMKKNTKLDYYKEDKNEKRKLEEAKNYKPILLPYLLDDEGIFNNS